MERTILEVLLNRVGKRVFVDFFEQFRRAEAADVVRQLPSEYTLKSRRSRTSKARRIFRERQAAEALAIIRDSGRVERETAERAGQILASFRRETD